MFREKFTRFNLKANKNEMGYPFLKLIGSNIFSKFGIVSDLAISNSKKYHKKHRLTNAPIGKSK